MSSHYHDPTDLDYLKKLRKGAPREFDAWLKYDEVVGAEDGAIPVKYRELLAVACALMTQCVYCIEDHVQSAKHAGASVSEVSEAALIAGALRAGGTVAHSALALKIFERGSTTAGG